MITLNFLMTTKIRDKERWNNLVFALELRVSLVIVLLNSAMVQFSLEVTMTRESWNGFYVRWGK